MLRQNVGDGDGEVGEVGKGEVVEGEVVVGFELGHQPQVVAQDTCLPVEVEVGNAPFIFINLSCTMYFMELQQLTPEKLSHVLAELRSQLDELYGSRLVRLMLYGSQARGDAMPGSDVDVLVVLTGPVNPAAEIERATPVTAALSLEHDIVISCLYVSEERYIQENSPLLLNVRREGVVV